MKIAIRGSTPIAPSLSSRAVLAERPEMMDQPCTYEDLRGCLRDIAQVNRLTFAYRPTFRWLDLLTSELAVPRKPLHLVDVGCGDGDMLRRISSWASNRQIPIQLTGIDLNPNAIRAAREVTMPGMVTFLHGNAYDFAPPEGVDLVISSLLTHHLENTEIVSFLRWMESTARIGWFINDLHRQAVPYWAFRILSSMTTWHRFVKHDGAVSILRSFRPDDWRALLGNAGIPLTSVQIQEHRPARLCVARLK